MKRPIENNSKPGDAIYEPFSGSGTTIIAGEMTARRVYAIELSPTYVDVAVLRWQAFTGAEATLEATGDTFAETREDRRDAPGRGRSRPETRRVPLCPRSQEAAAGAAAPRPNAR